MFGLVALLLVPQIAGSSTAFATKPATSSKSAIKPANVPGNGILTCLETLLTLSNPSVGLLGIAIGVYNACPADVSPPINYDIKTQILCDGKTAKGPEVEQSYQGLLVENHMYTIANGEYAMTCIIDGSAAPWTADVDVIVDGDIQYGNYDIASGEATRSLGGV